uniref:Uncharacterized protein AlNc14C32G2947 n=1 Tax=Albugo laibachii Nc14 TaxID=890382 RepID=F0W7Z7_9STRA|nr:conserved hypothetical protein [Albugo laibachii Nc14]|eukprot:CCA17250.1 conserved hypothetical protein [Albugo laibachii Nc14]
MSLTRIAPMPLLSQPRVCGCNLRSQSNDSLHTLQETLLFLEPVGFELPSSLSKFRWDVTKTERKLQEKISERNKISGKYVYQQACRLLGSSDTNNAIDYYSFKKHLRLKFGIILEDAEARALFERYDHDKNGKVDLREFVKQILSQPPADSQYFVRSQEASEQKSRQLRQMARDQFLMVTGNEALNTGSERTADWSIEKLKKNIQVKLLERTPGGVHQHRRAMKLLRVGCSPFVTVDALQRSLRVKFGLFCTEDQMQRLCEPLAMNASGEINLNQFLQSLEVTAYPRNSEVPKGLWTYPCDGSSCGCQCHEQCTPEKSDSHLTSTDFCASPNVIAFERQPQGALLELEQTQLACPKPKVFNDEGSSARNLRVDRTSAQLSHTHRRPAAYTPKLQPLRKVQNIPEISIKKKSLLPTKHLRSSPTSTMRSCSSRDERKESEDTETLDDAEETIHVRISSIHPKQSDERLYEKCKTRRRA